MNDDLNRLLDDADRDGITKLVVGALVHDRGQVLILRRSTADDFMPGIEELPSGGVESDETLLAALERELAEEIGQRSRVVRDPGFVASFDYVSGSGRKARQYTFALAYDHEPIVLSQEHTSYRWIGPDQLTGTDLTQESRQVIREWAAAADSR